MAALDTHHKSFHMLFLVANTHRHMHAAMLDGSARSVRCSQPPQGAQAVVESALACARLRTIECRCKVLHTRLVDVGNCGHINADSGLDDWSRGHALLEEFLVSVE